MPLIIKKEAFTRRTSEDLISRVTLNDAQRGEKKGQTGSFHLRQDGKLMCSRSYEHISLNCLFYQVHVRRRGSSASLLLASNQPNELIKPTKISSLVPELDEALEFLYDS